MAVTFYLKYIRIKTVAVISSIINTIWRNEIGGKHLYEHPLRNHAYIFGNGKESRATEALSTNVDTIWWLQLVLSAQSKKSIFIHI